MPFASEWLRGKAHGIKSTFSAVSGAVDLMGMEREAQAVQAQLSEQQLFEYSAKMTKKVVSVDFLPLRLIAITISGPNGNSRAA